MPSPEDACTRQAEVLRELDRIAPGAPMLALGQTVFWDEPMKAGVVQTLREAGSTRKFYAGVHDTDYFAKLPTEGKAGGFAAFPHNDTTTQALWSAAGEFAQLFGSETVVTRDRLYQAGVKVGRIAHERPGLLDTATEAWGWRGVVRLGDHTHITADTPIGPVFGSLYNTLTWAVESSLEQIAGDKEASRRAADELLGHICDQSSTDGSVAAYYRDLIPFLYRFVSGEDVPIETTATTELLRLNSNTHHLRRFDLLRKFVEPETRELSRQAYDNVVRGTEMYTLDRFGSWAVPFDVIVPGHGRGTLRIAPKALVIMTPNPVFVTLKKPVESVEDLAAALERKFGPECSVIGKAITLIGLLAREFVFVFHESASGYVQRTRSLLSALYPPEDRFNPILRVKYSPWDALSAVKQWFKLPEPMRGPFGTDDICSGTFSKRWCDVVQSQRRLLSELETLRRPADFIQWLADRYHGTWALLGEEYLELHERFRELQETICRFQSERRDVFAEIRNLRKRRNETYHAMGVHWRAEIFEKEATPEANARRQEYRAELDLISDELSQKIGQWQELLAMQESIVSNAETRGLHERRRHIEFEAELKRVSLVRDAVTTAEGLIHSGYRPSAWWFPLVSPDGSWFQETRRRAEYYLESLQ
ncbi:MAG: hypothetical protein JST40_03170 [Armatimonadetes bacterium]|nr:hypothetical protein [Armatimonadota bacterium]